MKLQSSDITVLICVHSQTRKHDKLFYQALTSLTQQTIKGFSVLIVLDECWQNTGKIIPNFFHHFPISVLVREKKQGLAFAKNYGLQHINTTWVAFLDADDQWLPEKLEVQIKYVNEMNNVEFFFTQAFDKFKNGVIKDNCFFLGQYETHEQIVERISSENCLCHGSALIQMQALRVLGNYRTDSAVKGKEDWDLWRRALDNGYHFYNIPERLYLYSVGTSVPR